MSAGAESVSFTRFYISEFKKSLVALERCDAELLGELILLEELWRTCAFSTASRTNPRLRSDLERRLLISRLVGRVASSVWGAVAWLDGVTESFSHSAERERDSCYET